MQLYGKIAYTGTRFFVLDVGGVGYKIFMLHAALSRAKKGAEFFVWTHLAVREDAMELYGFNAKEELDFFEMLIAISGIGPKSALAILNLAPLQKLSDAVRAGDTTYLTKVSGIGRKTAAKIVFELKEKLEKGGGEGNTAQLKEEGDALEALKSLGYGHKEARDVLQKVGSKHITMNEKIKEALKLLGT